MTAPDDRLEGSALQARLAFLNDVPFFKMTGSGNDFVFFDAREAPLETLTQPEVIRSICHRRNGIGADGLVVLEAASPDADVRIHYFNSDGSAADLCGNATLCSTTLAASVGLASASGMRLITGAGVVESRLDVMPAIDLRPIEDLALDLAITRGAGEERIGFVRAGIPHLVVLMESLAALDALDLAARGPVLRWDPSLGAPGANVNWVAPADGGVWRYRTFERGVEGETLACGTGAVATAALLEAWGLAPVTVPVTLLTSSGKPVRVRFRRDAARVFPTLEGEGRLVFRGRIGTLDAPV